MNSNKKLSKSFYSRNVHTVAKELLGKFLVRKINNKTLVSRIVEVEAYDGNIDEASHSFNGKTKRNEIMFLEGGYLYVYFTYGMHFCANIVTGKMDEGQALLLRALEPIDGIETMALNRFNKTNISEKEKINLTNGPAKICQTLSIKRNENGIHLCGNEIFLIDAPVINSKEIAVSTRIGIKKSVDLPWRYYIKNNPYISKK